MIFNIFLNAFNKLHTDKLLVGNQSTTDDARFHGCKHLDLTVRNIWDKENKDIFRVHKVITKNTAVSLENVWEEIYEEMIQRILEHYGNGIQ